eukprot:GCRY01003146.1.p1 GENE.GCRY01003146.1~~GCRY01003146.1.p1  ORF type:complete len:499 (+),score=97.57 GCRY01003146.1:100-1596(+)
MTSLLIKNGTVVNEDLAIKADVLVENGIIISVADDIQATPSMKVINADGKYVIPGGLDCHTHLSMPFMGTVTVDDYDTGTKAALCGGTTCVLDFVIPSPGQSLLTALDIWKKKASTAHSDYGFHMAVTWWSDQVREEMGILARERGVTSFKCFLAYKGSLMLDDECLIQVMQRAKELGCLPSVHAENGELVFLKQKELMAKGITGPEGHPQSRPVGVEIEATHRAIRIAEQVNVPLYVVHVSAGGAVKCIADARARGQRVFGEALVAHLVLDDSKYYSEDWHTAAQHVLSPPLRPRGNSEELWGGINGKTIVATGTDNCTFTRKQKLLGKDDFTKIPNGVNGLEDRMSVLWTEGVESGRISINDFVRLTSTGAARMFNCYPRKGCIRAGADADIVVWDPSLKRRISKDTHMQAIDSNIFEGRVVAGVPVATISQGELVWEAPAAPASGIIENWNEGRYSGYKGRGHFIPRATHGLAYEGLQKLDETLAPRQVKRQKLN